VTTEELEASLRAYERRLPFRPFLVEFVSGVQVRVDQREAIAFFGSVWLYRGPKKAQAIFPSSSVCRLLDLIPDN
jgi:hypothetical protein